jgi:hypothetical protein
MMWYLYRRFSRAGSGDIKTLTKSAQSRDAVFTLI